MTKEQEQQLNKGINKYIIRRGGQLVGTYTDKDQALADRIPGDYVFEVVETHGDFGCITEYPINN